MRESSISSVLGRGAPLCVQYTINPPRGAAKRAQKKKARPAARFAAQGGGTRAPRPRGAPFAREAGRRVTPLGQGLHIWPQSFIIEKNGTGRQKIRPGDGVLYGAQGQD